MRPRSPLFTPRTMQVGAVLLAIACSDPPSSIDGGAQVQGSSGPTDSGASATAASSETPPDDGSTSRAVDDTSGGDSSSTDAVPALRPANLTITLHLENHAPYDATYAAELRQFADAFAARGGRLTLEPRRALFMPADPAVIETLRQLEAGGHAVGAHAAIGAEDGLSQVDFVTELAAGRAELLDVAARVDHVSGICSPLDFVGAAADAGYAFTTAATVYCLFAMAPEARPEGYEDLVCNGAIDPVCHRSYPDDAALRIRPWRTDTGAQWLTDVPNGRIVLLPGSGSLPCLAEESGGDSLPGDCVLADGDLEIAFADLDASLATRDAAGYFTYYWIWGSWDAASATPEALASLLDGIDERVDAGDLVWANATEMYDGYVAWAGR